MTSQVIFLNDSCIGDSFGWQNRRQALGHQIVFPANPVPFLALVFQAVDVQSYGNAGDAKDGRKRRISSVANQRRVVTMGHRMERRQERMHDRVEVFVADGGENLKTDSLKFNLAGADVMSPTINSNLVAPSHQTRREVFSERLETAVVGGDSPRA